MGIRFLILITLFLAAGAGLPDECRIGNLGYNSYEGYQSGGAGLNKYFGPGVGYDSGNGDYFERYVPRQDWGRYGYGTGHAGEGYGPYIYSRKDGPSPPGLFDPLPEPYTASPPPKIKVKNGSIRVDLPSNLPGVKCVTVTLVAFNNAELVTQSVSCPPFEFCLPVVDGVRNVRVRIDYVNNGLSATSYPL